ncbi:MAG: histidinol-phosphatase HisJ family protein [Christensenellales bacterium]
MIDYHVHSSFSADCEAPMINMARAARDLKITELCFTEHVDIDAPGEKVFVADLAAYRAEFLKVQSAFPNLNMRFGVEAGLWPDVFKQTQALLEGHPLDYVIGSQHLIFGLDPYHNEIWKRYSQREIYDEYLRISMVCAASFDYYDVFGHLGYVGKFCPYNDKLLAFSSYTDAIDELLKTLVRKGKGLEVNTSGLVMTPSTMPETRIIERFKQLGGEIITIGSDAHRESAVGYAVPDTLRKLKAVGFRYVCAFDNRKPRFLPIP